MGAAMASADHSPIITSAPIVTSHPAPIITSHPAPIVRSHSAPIITSHPVTTYHAAPTTYADETPKPYNFNYAVHDSYAGATFSQHETSDAQTVTGSYSVALPDG